jgi:ribulose-phosphate 3-epimerase
MRLLENPPGELLSGCATIVLHGGVWAMIEVLPSILAADFARLGEQIASVENAGASILHVDVMDGHFVPNISIGLPVVESIRRITRLKLEVHLMISDADAYASRFIEAGADHVLVHQEACPHLDRTLRLIRDRGALAGVVVNPATPISTLSEVLDLVDHVLVMSVNPGFGGQQFIPNALHKVRALARKRKELGLDFRIEIDGGVALDNVVEIVRAGCERLVAGSSVFHTPDAAVAFSELQHAAREAALVRV